MYCRRRTWGNPGRAERPEQLGHDRRRQGLQGQRSLQHAHNARVPDPPPLPLATTGLFREHIPPFRTLFQKYITKGFVSEDEAGKRLTQVVSDQSLTKSGVYWSWKKTSALCENQLSREASDAKKLGLAGSGRSARSSLDWL
uniref:Uncharacterized protein n=1 Tax=Kalanchoe fedtschenkoi TaxID=63787 RepID=A0A7N0REE7_KALFE